MSRRTRWRVSSARDEPGRGREPAPRTRDRRDETSFAFTQVEWDTFSHVMQDLEVNPHVILTRSTSTSAAADALGDASSG